MPDNLSMSMILNIVFFGILGLGLLGGLAKGFKKSLFSFVTMAAFYALFFLTLDAVVGFLWTYENPALGTALGQIDSSLSSYTSIGEAMTPLLQFFAGDFDLGAGGPELTALLLGIGQFVVKIGYTVAYFTVGLIVWKILMWIVRMIFIHEKSGSSKNRLLGGVFGLANGALALFVLFIMLGGVVSIVGSVTELVPSVPLAAPLDRDRIYEASQSLIPLAEGDAGLAEATAYVVEFVDAYESNPLVQIGDMIVIGEGTAAAPLSLYLFDSVMSFTYEGETIALRRELAVVANVAGTIFDALDAAGIDLTNMENVDIALLLGAVGSADLTMLLDSKLITTALVYVLSGEAGIEDLDGILIVPDGVVWYDTLDDEGNIVENGELRNLLTALNAIVEVAGSIDFENIGLDVVSALSDDAIDAIFGSSILTATLSNVVTTQLPTGDNPLVIPDSVFDGDGYLLKSEMLALVHAFKLLVETAGADPENFDFAAVLSLSDAQVDVLLDSQILSATVGNLIADIAGEDLVIPSTVLDATTYEVDGVAVTVVSAVEIKAVFASLRVLGISDFDNMGFDAGIIANLEGDTPGVLDDAKIATLFGSDILHATMSDLIISATAEAGSVMTVPYYDQDGNAIRETLGDVVVISVAELGNVLKAVYALNVEDFANFNALDASALLEKMPILLDSAILHATISAQLLSIAGGAITVPYVEEDGTTEVRITVGDGIEATEYISQDELEAVIAALDALQITDPTAFGGTVSLSFFSDPDIRAALLDSAIMQATISDQLLSLGGAILIVPALDEDGEDVVVTVGPVGNQTTYVTAAEIGAMFDALEVLDVTDVTAVTSGEFTLSNLTEEGNLATLLASASIHATISDQLLTTAAGTLLIPDVDVENANSPIRIQRGTVEYVAKDEIVALIGALDLLDLDGFDSLDFSIGTLFANAVDMNDLLASASLQATISDAMLSVADDETTMVAGATDLVVPTQMRAAIQVDGVASVQIVQDELVALLEAFNVLGLGGYGAAMPAGTITGLSEAQIDALLVSASIHVTIHNMLQGNMEITTPDMAKSSYYGIAGVTTKVEVRNFIRAVSVLGTGDFTDADFSIAGLSGKSETDLGIILDSMIVRDTLTPQIEAADGLDPFYALDAADYMDGNVALFLTKTGITDYLNYLP
ncbi:MAG: hypothetical protein WC509_05330 [Candidatus Izemoplasmatales bacterium]